MADKPSGLKAPAKIGKPALTKQSGLKAPSNVAVKATVDASRKNDTENFIIGDKVLVSGTKVGKIQYLGECEFAPGQWAGVVLENPVGKNDGSVGGVKYFQCEPLHGVFARPNKLERATNTSSELTTKAKSAKNSRPSALTVANVKASTAVTPAKSKQSGLRSPTSSIRSLKLGGVSRTGAAAKPADIKVNDRVVVGESKIGTARYVGETDFAKGCWVGIELDEMLGKNDGSVAGKRYFTCAVNFGLFSLIQKVQKVGFPTTTPGRVKTTTTAAKKRPVATGTAVKSPGSSSAVSVSSLSSISSLKGPSKLRTEVSSRYKQKTAASGVQALQEALLEKQQHVESLLAERDMERNQLMEVNLTAAEKLSELRKMQEVHETFSAEKESQLDALRALVEQADQDKVRISQELEEEKRKNEDLQFRLEEGEICKEDLEADLIHFKEKCQDLEAGLSIERNKSLHLQTSLQETRALSVDDKSDLNTLRSERASFEQQLLNLKEQLSVAQDATKESGAEDPRIFELEEQVVEAKALMEEQEDALSKLRQQVQNLEKDKEQLLDQVQDIVSSNTTNTEFLQSEINEYKDQLLTFQQQCNSLKTEKENMKTEFDQVLLSSGDQNSQVKTLTDAISAKDEKIHSLEESFSNANSEIKTLEKTSENLKSDLLKYKEEILLLNSKLNSSEEAFKRAEENCTASSKTIEELNQRLQKADSTINASELCKKEMEVKLELLQKQAENVNANYKEASNNLLQLQDDFKKFKDESDATKETLTANFSELKNKKQELEKSHQNDENQIVRLSEQLAHLQKTNNESRETIEKMSQQKGEQTQHLVLQLQESQSSLAKLESARIAQQEKFAVLMQEKEALKKELQKAEENIKGILEEKSNLEDKANITNKDMAEFQQLNEELHKQIQTSSEEKKKLEESVKLISAEIKVTAQQSTEEVARFQLVISDLENNNTHLSEKVTASNEKIQAMQVQIRELTEDNRTLRLQITTSTEDLSYRNKEIESLMQDSDKKEQQLSELQIYIEKKENTILELQREVQLLTELKDEMQTALDGKNVEIREFSKNLAAEQVRMTNFELELNGCKEDAANKNKLIQNLEEDLVLLREKSDASSKAEQKSLFDANTCLKELQDKLEESTTKLAATEELLCTLQNEKVDLNDKLSTLLLESKDKSEKLELLNKSNSDLAELNSTYQQHLNSASENYASIETKYKEAESFALELKSKLEITAHELMAVQEKLDQTVGDLAICQSDLEIKTEILHKLETEHNRVSAMLMEAEDLAKSDGVQKNTLCEELVLTRSMLDETKKKVDDLESQLRIQSEACNAAEMSLLATKASETAVTQRLSETNDSLTEIKKELTRVNSEKSTEHKSKIDLQQKNDSLTSEAVRLSEELQNLQLDEARLKEEMLEKSQHLNEFEQALKLKEQEIEHSTAQVEQLRSEISLLKDKCDVAVAEAEEKSQQAVQSENAFRDVETEKRTLEDKLASLAAQQGDSEKKSFDYLDKIQTLEKSLTQVSLDLKVKSEGYDKLYGNFTDITTQRNSLQVLIEGLQKDKMELNAQTGKLTADIKGTCEQLETSKKENEDLKKKLIESSDELNVLKQQNNIVKEALKEKENKLLEVQCELVELTKKFEEQNTTLKTTHDEVTQLMADLSEAANSKKNLTKDLEMQTASNEKITMELCRTKTDLDNLTADLLTNNTNFETMLAEKQKLVEQVNSSNAALQAEYNSLNNKFSTATIELQNIGEERSALQKKLNVIAEKCDALENNLSKVQYDNKEVTVTLEKANLEIENVQSKCNMLTKNLQESGIQLQSATNENEQLQIKLEEITISKNSLGELLKKTANSEGDLVTQCNELTEKNLHTSNELHQAKALLDEKSIVLSQLEAANKQMEMSLLETKSNLETEQVNFATVSKEKEKLEDKIVELSSKIDALSSQECDLQAKLIEMSKLLEESNINCSSMTNLNEQHKAEIKELSLKADKLSVERAQFEAECEKHLNSSCELHTSLTKAEQEKLHESERLQESVAKCIALDAINSQAKVEIEAMKQKIDQGLKEKEHLQTELLNSQSSNADLHATLKQIEKEKDDIGEELKQIVLKCTSLEEANNHFKVEMEAINSKLKTVIDEKDQLETDASLQIISFAELQTQCYSLEEKVTTLEMELKMSQGSADENITALRCETSDLKEKIEKLLAEKLAAEQCLAEEKSNIETLQLGLDKIKQENADQISKIESLEQLLNASEDCVSRLKDAELQHTGHKQSLAEELQSVKDKLSQIETENQLKSKQLSDLYAEKEKSMLEIETLQTSSTAKSSESEVKITQLLKLNEQNNLEKSNIDSELQQFRLNYSKLQENHSSLESKAGQLNNSIDVLKQEKEMLQTEKNQLTELAEVLQAKVKKMEKSLPDIEEREAVLKKEFSQERESLQRSLDITTSLLEEKNKEMDASNREITYLKGEFVVQESVKERLKQTESEKDQLFEQVQHLKQQVKSGATTNGEGGAGDGGSADFLNAVIVNQQQKIAELTDKIKELEDLALNGDAELDDLDDEQRRQLPPRLFCDICDVFDAHDTEDCPTQSMEAEPDQGADTKYARGEQRPYCDDCEVFGHWTEECEEEQMY